MGRQPQTERSDAMYARYIDGLSLAQVAAEFGITRQSVYKMFQRRGFQLRSQAVPARVAKRRPSERVLSVARPAQFYQGQKYTLGDNGYFRCTRGDRHYLHRRVWEDANGPIPQGMEVHHLDHDRWNNQLDNFDLLTKEDHARFHGTGCNQAVHHCGR